MAFVALNANEMQVRQFRNQLCQLEGGLSRLDAATVLPDVELYQHIHMELSLLHGLVHGSGPDLAIHHGLYLWVVTYQLYQTSQLGLAYNFARNQEILYARLSHHLSFAYFGDAAADSASVDQNASQIRAFDSLEMWPDMNLALSESLFQPRDVGLHQCQIDDHRRRIQGG